MIIEELHSLPQSKKRTDYLEQIIQASQFLDIVLWEKKSLTKNNLKKLTNAQIYYFPMSKALWQLLDQFSPQAKTKKDN